MNERIGKIRGGRVCCVPGCSNTDKINPDKIFYSFPNRVYEVQRKKTWITRIRRDTIRAKPWVPTKYTRICSAHFVGGQKSNDPREESFNPSIFPWRPLRDSDVARKTRLAERNKKKDDNSEANCGNSDDNSVMVSAESDTVGLESTGAEIFTTKFARPQTCEIAIQTDENYYSSSEKETVLFCWQNSATNDASTQTVIQIDNDLRQKIKVIELQVPENKISKTIAIGPDCEMRNGFHGFADIKNDKAMKQLGGITLSMFLILVKFIKPKAGGQPKYYKALNSADRLILFLMKMRLGLPFTAISCLFCIGKQTAREIFLQVLQTLYLETKTWIFWPSKEAVKKSMPDAFKLFPNCRSIIDCTELRCQTPPTVEQRALFYSTYKSTFTVKYLISITPSGFISFISKGYGGRSSDSQIVIDSGFVNLIEPGDEIMADKGFPQIQSELIKKQCSLIIPPFAVNPQFTREEVLRGYSIASVRIHVERSIQRVRLFKILDYVSIKSLPYIDKIMFMACVLANNKEPIIR